MASKIQIYTHKNGFRKHPEYILITQIIHVVGKDKGRCDQNKDSVMLPERGSKADAQRGTEKEQLA